MSITIISVGSKPGVEVSSLIDTYQKRLPKNINIRWSFVKNGSSADPSTTKQQEAEMILKLVPEKCQVILLDETGKQLDNASLSQHVFSGGDTCFIIGGSYGVAQQIFDCADVVWSLSKLVFPHQIVRVLLAEQLYRSYTISIGHPYHHN